MSQPAPVFVHLLPSLIPPGALKGGVAVVVDVLRATTAMVHALNSGCAAIIPCLEVEDAKAAASRLPSGSYVLAGERQGIPIPGFDFGNSPGSFTPEVVRGKTLVMTTTNGTRAILASLDADRILIAAFPNAGQTVAALEAEGRPIHIVCSGTNGRVSIEDTVLAGYFVHALDGARGPANDEAEIAERLWMFSEDRLLEGLPLEEDILLTGSGGKRVTELGFTSDIRLAGQIDRIGILAELHRDPLRIVSVDIEPDE